MSNTKKTPLWALDNVRFSSDAGGDLTCREYLCELLGTLWNKESGFDGKRPFGNSGWQHDMYDALVESKCIKRRRTEYGLVPDEKAGRKFVFAMIDAMGTPTPHAGGTDA